MMRANLLIAVFLALAMAPVSAHAEGDEGKPATVVSKAKPKPKTVAKPKPVTTPVAPIPYTTYAGIKPDTAPGVAKALTPEPVAPSPVTEALPYHAETAEAANIPPPPPPAMTPSTPPAQAEIALRCETKTTQGKRLVSSGTFYIDLFPSPVFPDQSASFKFLFADPNHKSLIRETICLDTLCSAQVSGTAYYLVNRVTKKGAALRITLDRSKGAFYAEEIEKGMVGGSHLGEQGYCTPQALPEVKF